jgi:hypothetical protein
MAVIYARSHAASSHTPGAVEAAWCVPAMLAVFGGVPPKWDLGTNGMKVALGDQWGE